MNPTLKITEFFELDHVPFIRYHLTIPRKNGRSEYSGSAAFDEPIEVPIEEEEEEGELTL